MTGNPSTDPPIDTERLSEYPVYLVSVPASFTPDSWHTVPPGANHYPSGEVAAEVVAVLNRAKIKASPDGSVTSWFIRLRKSTGGASISVNLIQTWKPMNEYDLPPAFMTMKGQVMQWRGIIADLNERLRRTGAGRGCYQRAYVAHSSRPEDLKPLGQPEGESVSSGGDAGPKQIQPGSVYLIDVPKDYEPYSPKSLPGPFQLVKDREIAQVAAVRANQRLIERSTHGAVFAWYIPVDASGGYGIVQFNIPSGWAPADAYDMPAPMTVIPGKKKRKQFLKELNRQLDRGCSRGRKRAYAAVMVDRPAVSQSLRSDRKKGNQND
ncbi:hypothetical protein [Gimesia panareensis]|uniref:hypothetical protein n=1 Tax=Gimesia panareensis TaxID=2527978 RepID=UPI0011AA96D0|nr:hypothetical protein [Gimesia panareensis]